MEDKEAILKDVLKNFAGLTDNDISVSLPLWRTRTIKKGEFFNRQNIVCKDLGIVVKGIFRIYYADDKHSEEKNMFFFSERQFIVSFRSFINQYPCHYYIEALEDAEIIYIPYLDLQRLYLTPTAWEKFGRLLAEQFFNYSQARAEELLFLSHEQHYLRLLDEHPNIVNRIAAYHISSYLGIKNPSLSRIRKRIQESAKYGQH
jgi:CRP-like cAMP-binding protein